jgi:hypothetical protein
MGDTMPMHVIKPNAKSVQLTLRLNLDDPEQAKIYRQMRALAARKMLASNVLHALMNGNSNFVSSEAATPASQQANAVSLAF